MAAPEPSTSYSFLNMSSLKANLKKYGRTGVAVYLGISLCVTSGALFVREAPFLAVLLHITCYAACSSRIG